MSLKHSIKTGEICWFLPLARGHHHFQGKPNYYSNLEQNDPDSKNEVNVESYFLHILILDFVHALRL